MVCAEGLLTLCLRHSSSWVDTCLNEVVGSAGGGGGGGFGGGEQRPSAGVNG